MRFRLSTLLLSILVVATSLAMAGRSGIAWAVWALILVAALRGAFHGLDVGKYLAALLILAGLVVVFVPMFEEAKHAARWSRCSYNLRQIVLACRNYYDIHRRLPPPCLREKDGTPAHSWRLLMLPSLEQGDLYRKYNFRQPWNGPANAPLAAARPHVYGCPANAWGGSPGATMTSYVALVGPGTVWEQPLQAERAESLTSARNPILLIEVADSGIVWTEPKDLPLEEALAGISAEDGTRVSSRHPLPGVNVGFLDGSVELLPANTPPDLLKALFADGLDDDKRAEIRRLKAGESWSRRRSLLFGLSAWAVSLLVLLVHGMVFDLRRKRTDRTLGCERESGGDIQQGIGGEKGGQARLLTRTRDDDSLRGSCVPRESLREGCCSRS